MKREPKLRPCAGCGTLTTRIFCLDLCWPKIGPKERMRMRTHLNIGSRKCGSLRTAVEIGKAAIAATDAESCSPLSAIGLRMERGDA